MSREVTNKELAKSIDDLAQVTANGFEAVDKRFEAIDQRFDVIENRLDSLGQRFDVLERKVDRALYQDLDRHERWIRQLAGKVGVELT